MSSQESVRFVLDEAAQPGFQLFSADVRGAYLEADLPYPVHLTIPPTADDELEAARVSGKVLCLRKYLYGLVESGYFWSKLLKSELVKLGFICLDSDKGLYVLRLGGRVLYMPTHFDDLLGATDDPALWTYSIDGLAKRITFSKNEPTAWQLVSLIEQVAEGSIFVSQAPYIMDMPAAFGVADAKPCATPMVAGSYIGPDADGPPLSSITPPEYLEVIGKINWVFASSHPDIAVPVRSGIGDGSGGGSATASGGAEAGETLVGADYRSQSSSESSFDYGAVTHIVKIKRLDAVAGRARCLQIRVVTKEDRQALTGVR